MNAVIELTHRPVHPSFDCAACGEPWPCPPAKVELAEQYRDDVLGLSCYLGAHLADAMDQAIGNPAWGRVDNLYERFLGWMPRARGNRAA